MTEQLLVSITEAQHALGGVSRGFMNGLLASGRVPSVKLGRRRMIPFDALEDLVDELRAEASAEVG